MTNETQKTDQTARHITYAPRVDIISRGDETTLLADMPGIDEKSVEVLLEDNVLTLAGRRNVEVPAGLDVAREENAPTEYRRMFEVSHDIDRNRIKATVKNGVLRVVLPRDEKTRPKKIKIASD